MGGLAERLREHTLVALDTNCLVYYLEDHPWARHLQEAVFSPVEEGRLRAVISMLAIAEILVRPKAMGRHDVCEEYVALLCSYPNLEVAPVTLEIAIRCAEIRASHRVRTPDAIALATACQWGASLFLTNDADLPSTVGGTEVVLLSDLLPSAR
ncbi:MAG: PIN domain-containing protein [Bacillota bacterium]